MLLTCNQYQATCSAILNDKPLNVLTRVELADYFNVPERTGQLSAATYLWTSFDIGTLLTVRPLPLLDDQIRAAMYNLSSTLTLVAAHISLPLTTARSSLSYLCFFVPVRHLGRSECFLQEANGTLMRHGTDRFSQVPGMYITHFFSHRTTRKATSRRRFSRPSCIFLILYH
jgi:hypothetical protein